MEKNLGQKEIWKLIFLSIRKNLHEFLMQKELEEINFNNLIKLLYSSKVSTNYITNLIEKYMNANIFPLQFQTKLMVL